MIGYLRSRRYIILFGFVFVLLALIPFTAHVSVDLFFKPQVRESQAALYQNLDKILNDLDMLDKNPIFPPLTTQNNAEYLISRYVEFGGFENNTVKNPRYDVLEKIDRAYHQWRNNPEILQNMLYDQELMGLNTKWLERLNNYDHWNFSSNKHVTESLAVVPNVNSMTRVEIFTQLPTPNYNSLRAWALVNFLKKYKKGQGYEGLETYRKISQLINTTGTLIGNITAASMLKEEYVLASKFNIKNWQTKPFYFIESYVRISWAWVGLMKLPLFDRLPKKFVRFMKPQNGVCASSWESIATYSIYLDFFQPQAIFESNFSKNVKFTADLYKTVQQVCNLQNYEAFLTRSPASVSPFNSSFKIDASIYKTNTNTDYNYSVEDNWIYLPYVRRLVGLSAFSNPGPMNYVNHYMLKKKKFSGENFQNIF